MVDTTIAAKFEAFWQASSADIAMPFPVDDETRAMLKAYTKTAHFAGALAAIDLQKNLPKDVIFREIQAFAYEEKRRA